MLTFETTLGQVSCPAVIVFVVTSAGYVSQEMGELEKSITPATTSRLPRLPGAHAHNQRHTCQATALSPSPSLQ